MESPVTCLSRKGYIFFYATVPETPEIHDRNHAKYSPCNIDICGKETVDIFSDMTGQGMTMRQLNGSLIIYENH